MNNPPDLSGDVLKQRVMAACWLNGIGMRELRDVLADLEATKLLAEDMISGEKPQSKRNRRDLAEALEVPIEWFTEPDWRDLIVGARRPPEHELEHDLADAEATSKDGATRRQPKQAHENG